MSWQVHSDGKVRHWSEDQVRRKLEKGDLSGMELVRTPEQDDWRPLHTTPLFRDAVPHTGDAASQAMWRVRAPLFAHAFAFVAVIGAMTLHSGGVPDWWQWWALGLAIHGMVTVRSEREARRYKRRSTTTQDLAKPVKKAAPALPDSEVLRAIESLAAAGWQEDTTELRATASELVRRRELVEKATDEALRARLLVEQQSIAADREGADAATAELLDAQTQAVAQRLAFLDDADQLARRLRARERTLLHQLESLRLATISAETTPAGAHLNQTVTRLRHELAAEREVTDSLARARAAQRA